MAASSKSSQKVKNVVIALLALWSIISLITIVVWATSPDLKGSAQCRAELQEATEKLEGAKVVFNKNKEALEQLVLEEREKQAHLRAENKLLMGQLNATNATLEECRQENAILNRNITVLQEDIEQLRQKRANLTMQIGLLEDNIETLQQNMTEANLQTTACLNLKAAADSEKVAAHSLTKVCKSQQEHLKKQLEKCQVTKSEAPQQTEQKSTTPPSGSAAAPPACIPVLMLLVCSALHLITCE